MMLDVGNGDFEENESNLSHIPIIPCNYVIRFTHFDMLVTGKVMEILIVRFEFP